MAFPPISKALLLMSPISLSIIFNTVQKSKFSQI